MQQMPVTCLRASTTATRSAKPRYLSQVRGIPKTQQRRRLARADRATWRKCFPQTRVNDTDEPTDGEPLIPEPSDPEEESMNRDRLSSVSLQS